MSLLIYQSDPNSLSDPRCETKVIAVTPELFPSVAIPANCKPCATPIVTISIAIGRNVTASASGAGGNYSVAFTGAVPVAGTWIVATIQDNTGATGISGGTNAWTTLPGGFAGYQTYTHLCTASEPASYSVTYAGASKGDGVHRHDDGGPGANSSNPDSTSATANTGTASTVTSVAFIDCCVICASSAAGSSTDFNGAPTGFSLQGRIYEGDSPNHVVAIATKLNCGSGTVSPGTWTNPNTLSSFLWSLTFKV